MPPLLIGLTGGIGTGKSSVAAELATLGADVVSGDELGKRTLEETPALLAAIRQRFGDAVLDSQGNLLRRELGKRVFAGADDARWLTEQTFPGIHARWREAVRNTRAPVLVFDAALIFEWGIEDEFDIVLVVHAPPEQVLERMSASGRLSRAEVLARLAAQVPPAAKAARAHVVLENNGPLEEFRARIRQFWNTHVEPELHLRSDSRHGPSR